MKDVIVLRDLEQIKAISHPYRVEILESFKEEPLCAKQLAEILGEPHAKINYHIKTLLSAGILELVEEKIKSGIIEKYYLPVARMIVIDKSILNSSNDNIVQTLNQASISLFEKISDDFYRAAENNEIRSKHLRHYNEFYLTEDEAKEIMDILNEKLYEILENKNRKDKEGVRPYNIALIAVPDVRKEKNISKKSSK
ncbi:Helix-turn-helix domain-containing protein [Alkalithermobacter thermoalcaliphilus JW-YL-7 = DSM 7308]|uniref:Helix-turn-helix domain-containing protein n=1 Tax=Alkalithermobacter thermoalcaliphilus JW-YL-7 = DSM 7308 TaxID=1121328 RepID=A0A150FNW6_CLOPD|nr:transcriptional regulator, ArsR family [[Clostridium] paradoxum JW-YL-7 = DSM 7308]SHK84585.1 Helix-turn-helix domain-containing protein [[Clostridium] paradoxum JW-YL-7 = DSM 7308]